MAVKTKEDVVIHSNGTAPEAPTSKTMDGFQRKYMKRLVNNFERAKASVEQAQDAANDFISACAEEEGVTLGMDGWTFDLEHFEFVRVPQAQGGGHGDDSRPE